jgi:hypothetical protein
MSIILILLGLLFIMIILRLFIVKEGFESIPLNPITIQSYDKFLSFYNTFCASWKKAIESSVASEIPQQPATDPSNVTGGNKAPTISESDMNKYITTLSSNLSIPFPPICIPLPKTVDSTNIVDITNKIPTDIQPYINALNWMNPQLAKSQANLGSALKGKSYEGFDNMCQNVATCLANDPELIQQIAIEVSEQNDQQIVVQQEQLIAAINPFFTNSDLSTAFGENQLLFQKAQEIQDQAQSGELVNQIDVPGGRTIAKYQKPAGADNLINMKQNDPARYNELKNNYSMWTNLKSMLDNINANLS